MTVNGFRLRECLLKLHVHLHGVLLTDTVNFVFTFTAMISKTNLPTLQLKIQQNPAIALTLLYRLQLHGVEPNEKMNCKGLGVKILLSFWRNTTIPVSVCIGSEISWQNRRVSQSPSASTPNNKSLKKHCNLPVSNASVEWLSNHLPHPDSSLTKSSYHLKPHNLRGEKNKQKKTRKPPEIKQESINQTTPSILRT